MNPVFFFGLVLVLSAGFFLAIKMAFSPDKESKKSEDALKKAVSDRDTFEKELKNSYEEIAKIKEELSLKTQMFEGLKGQYNELEKDYEKLTQKTQETAGKDKPKPQPGNTESKPQAGPPQVIKPEPDKDKATGPDKNEPETNPPQTSA